VIGAATAEAGLIGGIHLHRAHSRADRLGMLLAPKTRADITSTPISVSPLIDGPYSNLEEIQGLRSKVSGHALHHQ